MRSRIKAASVAAVVMLVAAATLLNGGAAGASGDPVLAGNVTDTGNLTYVKNLGVQCPDITLSSGGFAACGDYALFAEGTNVGLDASGGQFGVSADSLAV